MADNNKGLFFYQTLFWEYHKTIVARKKQKLKTDVG